VLSGALRRNIEVSITEEEALRKIEQQEYRCALTGVPITFPKSSSAPERYTASLDRVDSSGAYTAGNIQWVHKDINIMKGALTEPYFIELCRKVVQYGGDLSKSS